MTIDKWDLRFLELARHVATWSKDPSTKVGAVIVDDFNAIVSLGYNGLPRGVADTEERLDNRDLKYKMIVHAERNALLFAKRDLFGTKLYTWPFMPCAACAGMIIQSRVEVVYAPVNDNLRWAEDFRLTRRMFGEANVALHEVDFPLEHYGEAAIKQLLDNLTSVQERCTELLLENRRLKEEKAK